MMLAKGGSMGALTRGLWLVLLLTAWAPLAAAQEEEMSGTDAEARALFDAGRVAFDEGRFENALEHFQRAYDLSQRPGLLFNIGTAADRLRDDEVALHAFERYLELVPDTENRASVEARIAALRRALERSTPTPDEPSVVPEVTANVAGGGADPAPWILVGTGAAIAVAGAILLTVAMLDLGALEDVPDGSSWTDLQDDVDRVPLLSGLGIGALAVGAATAVVGVVWAVAGGGSSETATLRVGPSGVALAGRFQ
jgi:hypothetical protein